MNANMVSEYAQDVERFAETNMPAAVTKTGLGLITLASLLKAGGTGNTEADSILKQIRDLAARLNEIDLREDSDTLVEELSEHTPEDLFDDLIIDLKGREATEINNGGFEAQFSYIVQKLGFKRAREIVDANREHAGR